VFDDFRGDGPAHELWRRSASCAAKITAGKTAGKRLLRSHGGFGRFHGAAARHEKQLPTKEEMWQ